MIQQIEEYIVDILRKQLGLDNNHIWIAAQNRKIPPQAQELFITVGAVMFKPISSKSKYNPETNTEVQMVYGRVDVQVDIFSRNNEARMRRAEILMALNSFYSDEVQNKNSFRIFELPSVWNNTSYLEGSSTLNRFTMIIPTMAWVKKEINSDYYDKFRFSIEDGQGQIVNLQIPEE